MTSSHSLLFRGGTGIRFLDCPSLLHHKPNPHPATISGFRSNSKPIAANFSISELRGFPGTAVPSSSPAGLSWVSRMSSETAAADGSSFVLSDTCTLKILKGDITQWSVDGSSDAIVNPANELMLGGGGADGAIHRAAGPELKEACYKVPEVKPGVRCPTGEARITPGFKLPASHVIHTVGPVYDSDSNPPESLKNAYKNSLIVAKANKIQYIAFPAISCGVFRYPFIEAATIAISTVTEFGKELKEVHFVLFSDELYDIWLNKAKELLQAYGHN